MDPNPYVYQYYTLMNGLTGGAQWIPRDKAVVTTFETACRGDGGTPVEMAVGHVPGVFVAGVANGCPSDMGTVQIDTTLYRGIVCYENLVGCGSPNIQ
jgi:hypothetical protein